MAPAFYHYMPVPMGDCSKESVLRNHRVPWWLVVLLVLVVVGLTVTMIIYIVKANSETCKNGFQAEECLSVTHPLQQQLDQTREDLWGIKAQAATCNQTVETLNASLEEEKVHSREKQDQVQELQGEIMNLVQKLQSALAEVEQLRRLSETTSTSNQKKVSPFLFTGLLLLGLRALLS